MARFPTAGHAASWTGLRPGNNESAGKRLSGRTRHANRTLRQALVESARGAVLKRNSYLAAQYRRLVEAKGSAAPGSCAPPASDPPTQACLNAAVAKCAPAVDKKCRQRPVVLGVTVQQWSRLVRLGQDDRRRAVQQLLLRLAERRVPRVS